jgi:hypothetical protein
VEEPNVWGPPRLCSATVVTSGLPDAEKHVHPVAPVACVRDDHDHATARTKDPKCFGRRAARIEEAFQYVDAHHDVKAGVLERKIRRITDLSSFAPIPRRFPPPAARCQLRDSSLRAQRGRTRLCRRRHSQDQDTRHPDRREVQTACGAEPMPGYGAGYNVRRPVTLVIVRRQAGTESSPPPANESLRPKAYTGPTLTPRQDRVRSAERCV